MREIGEIQTAYEAAMAEVEALGKSFHSCGECSLWTNYVTLNR